jgi:selenocysteine lyase/cysteine desulfurase
MAINRRNFLTQSGLGMLAATLFTSWKGEDLPPEMPDKTLLDSHSEKYWKQIRKQFVLYKDRIYLNNGTMGPSPKPVIAAMNKTMVELDVHVGYGGWEKAGDKIAEFVKASADEIALTHNVTEGINIVCWGLPLFRGDEVIMTTHEHVGGASPWMHRAHLDGIVVKTFAPAATAAETLQRINETITPRTRAIAVPHMPCTQGQILPVKEICKLAKDKNIFAFIDGAHGPGMLQLDLHDIGCDFYASCTHKWLLGPKGTGFLYVKKEMLEVLQAKMVGSNGALDWNMAKQPPEFKGLTPTAKRYYYGTQNKALYDGVEAAIAFMNEIGMDQVEKRVRGLAKYTQDQLLQLGDGIEMLTPTEDISRGAVVGFRIRKMDHSKFYNLASENKIRIRSVPENGINSLRVSTHIYNSKEEIDKLITLVKTVV